MTHNETTLKILECAKNDFLQNGSQGVSLKEICHHAGVTTGALYYQMCIRDRLVIVAAGLVGGLIGGLIGQKALKKHFIKAGLVSVK